LTLELCCREDVSWLCLHPSERLACGRWWKRESDACSMQRGGLAYCNALKAVWRDRLLLLLISLPEMTFSGGRQKPVTREEKWLSVWSYCMTEKIEKEICLAVEGWPVCRGCSMKLILWPGVQLYLRLKQRRHEGLSREEGCCEIIWGGGWEWGNGREVGRKCERAKYCDCYLVLSRLPGIYLEIWYVWKSDSIKFSATSGGWAMKHTWLQRKVYSLWWSYVRGLYICGLLSATEEGVADNLAAAAWLAERLDYNTAAVEARREYLLWNAMLREAVWLASARREAENSEEKVNSLYEAVSKKMKISSKSKMKKWKAVAEKVTLKMTRNAEEMQRKWSCWPFVPKCLRRGKWEDSNVRLWREMSEDGSNVCKRKPVGKLSRKKKIWNQWYIWNYEKVNMKKKMSEINKWAKLIVKINKLEEW